MKIRNGFVSNSSSSSFCILGMCIDTEIANKLKQLENRDNFALYEGDQYGYVVGLWAEEYLEENKLQKASEKAKEDFLGIVPKEIQDILPKDKFLLLYDSYYV